MLSLTLNKYFSCSNRNVCLAIERAAQDRQVTPCVNVVLELTVKLACYFLFWNVYVRSDGHVL
jgi:hypothetical protein